jgi:hypothetical protein
MEVATGAGACGRCRRNNKMITIAPTAMTATPPTAPPTMTPKFELLFFADDEEAGFVVEDEEASVPVGD